MTERTPVPATDDERPFTVTLARSGARYKIPPGKSIVAVLAENGVIVPTNCRQGNCGTCLTRVIEGTPLHRDNFLTDAAKRQGKMMTLCVSRAEGEALILGL